KAEEGENMNIGYIGLGQRGQNLLKTLLDMEDVKVPAVSEPYEDRLAQGIALVEASGRRRPDGYADYRELLAREDVEGVIVATSWTSHAEICIAAMKAGKYAA